MGYHTPGIRYPALTRSSRFVERNAATFLVWHYWRAAREIAGSLYKYARSW